MAFFTSVPTVYLSEALKPKIKNAFLKKISYIIDFLIALPFLYLSFINTNFLFSFFYTSPIVLDTSMYLNGVVFLSLALLFSGFVQAYIAVKNQALYKDLENIKLKNENLKKDLKMMTNYINPHFLFNSLNSLAGLISENPKRAENVTIILSQLYRGILLALQKEFHSIEEELNICKDYLEIEKNRFEDRLTVELNINASKNELISIQIPVLILQPLFENVIKHGVMNNSQITNCIFNLSINQQDLKVSISNNFCSKIKNIGSESSLIILRERLNLIYHGQGMLSVVEKDNQFSVSLNLPTSLSYV